ncbi:translocation/assembly module TamB [Aliidongia dinghuensis]|uniref:Translocation/assembly module TamB n=1 Tax=Aliidongia dinghuensis TaxID=1867774 RepID=A0A8J2YRR5_9PROT|nr:translocation/assembly module TamB domain-containing protein [Aliidongia dinghuensis]GGF07103.1 translocation/assembly module TamB [Aliidongia dinghuensis]
MRRVLRWIGLGLAAIVVLIVVAFAGGLWWLGSAGGHAWLTAQVTGALTSADTKATIAGLEGAVPFHLRLARLELADRDGTWLTVENAAVDLDAAALLRGTARIDRIAAGHILVARAPLPSTTPSQPSNEPFSLPRLPVGIELGSLDVPAIDLGAPLLGEPARLTLDGKASLHRGRADAAISLVRVGAAPGKATLALTLDDRTLTLDLEAADQSGELMAKLDPDAGAQPLDLTLKGSGPLTGWHGRLDGSTGGGAKLGADLSLALDKAKLDQGWAASIKGTADVAALLADQMKPAAGTDIAFDIAAAGPKDKPITLDHADLRLAAGSVAAKGWFDPAKQTLDATATIKGDVHTLESVAGQPVQGNFELDLGMKGAVARPTASIRLDAHGLSAGENGVGTVTAKLDLVTGTDDLLHITGGGRFDGIKAAGAPPPDALGDRLDWTVDLTADKQASRIQLGKATASGAGVAFEASGRFDGTAADGTLHLAAADLARFGGLAGLALGGSVTLDGTVASPDGKAIDAKLTGRLADLKTGIPEADGLLGGTVTLKAAGGRSAAGTLSLADLAVSGTDVNLTGHGTFDPKAEALDGKAVLSLPRLAALGAGYAGQATVTVDATGKPNDPAVTAQVDGTGIEAGGRKIDRLAVTAKLASLIQRSVALQAKLDAGQLSATLAGTVAQTGDAAYTVKDLKLAGPGTRLAVDGTVDLAAKRGSGSIDGAVNDLVAWAPLAGMPLGGGVKITGKLAGTAAKLDLDATHLAVGASADNGRTTLEHLGLAADLSDIWARPRGKLTLDVTKLVAAGASVDHAKLAAASDKAGAFGFTLDGAGTAQKPFQVAAQGSLALGPGSDATLRLAKFDGKFADLPFDLRRQLTLARKGTGMSFADLALAVGQGSITGAGNADGRSLKLDLDGKNLSIGALGALAGQAGTEGTLGFSAKLSGSPARPAGAVTVAVPDLKLAAATHPDLPPVGVAVTAELAPGRVDVKGKVDGLKNQAIGFYGHGPLQIKPDLSGVVIPPDGAILFKLEGEGRLETLSEMLPLGEDRVGGAFTIDLSVGGTVAHPDAGGQLAIRDGRYDNDASGMTLRALTVDLAGNQQSFVLRSLAGNDGGQGTVGASGRVDLAAAGGPALDLKAELKSFTAARGDTATAIVSGTAAVSGPLSGPAVKAAITLDRADINVPDQLPPNVAKLDVVRIDSRYPNRRAPESQAAAPPFAATLDIDFSSPGQCFVRGRGLDSEWRGKLHVGGTSAAPVVTGQFEVANGTFAVLSHTFTIQRGIVGFAGSTNPELDLLATAKTADITANVLLQGSPTSPTLKLTSTPELPQDEVLSRVLFGTSVGQVSAVQGLQLAAAAASLASGGGPGVLDRVRNATGLDRLTLNSDNTSTSSGSSSSSQKGALGGASVSGGKYVAPGVFVGVDQGAGAGSTKARVEVEIVPRVTVDATVGTGSESTSMGVNYKFDY